MTEVEINKMFKDTFKTASGKKCLKHLQKLIDRPKYVKGSTFEETTFREGQADVVRQITNEVERNV